MFNKLKSFTDEHMPEKIKEKMKEIGQTIAPSAGGGSGSNRPPERPELVPLRALQKVPPPNPEGTPEMVSCIWLLFSFFFFFFFSLKASNTTSTATFSRLKTDRQPFSPPPLSPPSSQPHAEASRGPSTAGESLPPPSSSSSSSSLSLSFSPSHHKKMPKKIFCFSQDRFSNPPTTLCVCPTAAGGAAPATRPRGNLQPRSDHRQDGVRERHRPPGA